MSGCRIGRVRLKGAATVLPFRQTERDCLQEQIAKSAANIANQFAPGEMGGYLIIGYGLDGAYTTAFRVSDDGPITITLLPAWAADVLRRELVANGHWH